MKVSKEDRKLSVYFPYPMVEEINELAEKLDRSKSWLLQKAWKLAKENLNELNTPYPDHLVQKFQKTVSAISEKTKLLSEKDIEDIAVRTVREMRKK